MIRLAGIGKSFAGTPALTGVDLDIASGRVLGLLGENGAGKSTLMRIVFGLLRADRGTIAIDGEQRRIDSPRDALRLGIGMVHQHFALAPALDGIDNLALALSPGLGVVHRAQLRERIQRIAAELGWSVELDIPVGRLSVGDQQRIEILKALAGGGRTLILDEPTAVLPPAQIDELIRALRVLAGRGVAVVLIAHKLDEVMRACDDIAILRRGTLVHRGPIAGADRAEIARLMMGDAQRIDVAVPRTGPGHAANTAVTAATVQPLTLRGVTVRSAGAVALLSDIELTIRAGEIVGIAGVDGNGQAALFEVAVGLRAVDAGSVTRCAELGSAALAVIPEDRQRDGVILALPVRDNLLLKSRATPPFARAGWLRPRAWRRHAAQLCNDFAIRSGSLSAPVATLSGGNQQKVVVARELNTAPAMVVAANPTRGLDIAATTAVMARLRAARDGGAGVLLIDSDLDELMAASDRIFVLHSGRLRDSGWPKNGRDAIGRMMLGLTADAAT